MESPAKKYKTLSDIDNIKDIAYEVLFTRYIVRNLKEEAKEMLKADIDEEDIRVNPYENEPSKEPDY